MKSEFNIGFRRGLFVVNDLNQTAVIGSNYIDIAVIAPLSFEINDHCVSNFGIGTSFGYVTGKSVYSDIQPTPVIRDGNIFKLGVIADYHVLFVGELNHALIGSRVLIEPAQYSYYEWSVYFGFSMSRPKKQRSLNK